MAVPVARNVPIDLRNPRVSTLAGNAYWSVKALTAWDAGVWEFLQDVDGYVYGVALVPPNVATADNASVVLAFGSTAASGTTRLEVASALCDTAQTFNPATLTAEIAQDLVISGARLRHDASFALTPTLTADAFLIVRIGHIGTHANDTLAAATELYGAFLRVDVT